MGQQYNGGAQYLEVGVELVSPHLRWLVDNLLGDNFDLNTVNILQYRVDVPRNEFGEACPAVKGICINLTEHFQRYKDKLENVMNIEKEKRYFMYSSMHFLIIRELLDTVAHEAYHLKVAAERNDWSNSKIDEDKAKEEAERISWHMGKDYDCDVQSLGPVLDDLLSEWYKDLEQQAEESREKGEEIPEWIETQLYMHENHFAYYHPDSGELTYRRAFEVGSKDEESWINEPRSYMDTTKPQEQEHTEEQAYEQPATQPQGGYNITNPQQNWQQPPVQQNIPPNQQNWQQDYNQPYQPEGLFDDSYYENVKDMDAYPANDPYGDYAPQQGGSQLPPLNFQTIQNPQPNQQYNTQQNTQQYNPQQYNPQPNQQYNPQQYNPQQNPQYNQQNQFIEQVKEAVFRRIFHHLASKGSFNGGVYYTPNCVYEPIVLVDIPNADKVVIASDVHTPNGPYTAKVPCNGQITGAISGKGLPKYTLYLIDQQGAWQKHTIIVQNPTKIDGTGRLSPWAEAVQRGDQIMLIIGDNAPLKFIRLNNGQTLGQELYSEIRNNGNR